jgi:uncharacterized integral membrane protein
MPKERSSTKEPVSSRKTSGAAKHADGKEQAEKASKEKQEAERKPNYLQFSSIIAVLIALILVLVFLIVPNLSLSVPFSTFKSNFYSAQNVAIVVNSSSSYSCMSSLIETVSAKLSSKSAINLFILNTANDSCGYSHIQPGHNYNINLVNETEGACLSSANSDVGVFLNYSSTNMTKVTQRHLYVDGNAAYMSACPIAVDMS